MHTFSGPNHDYLTHPHACTGPKIYNAHASILDDRHSGSTRLHLDVADAVNILTYAGTTPSGNAGYACWHVFSPEHAPALREYLRTVRQGASISDPIHDQATYLTPAMLHELYLQHGVRPYVIHQYLGDAVFIPAGCPHQVSSRKGPHRFMT